MCGVFLWKWLLSESSHLLEEEGNGGGQQAVNPGGEDSGWRQSP